MKAKLLFCICISFLTITHSFSQSPAKLDSSFLTIGEFWDGYLNQYQSIIASEALPDSTLVYVAQVTASTGASVMIKLKNDGTIDSTFAINGKLSYTIGGIVPTVKNIKFYNGKYIDWKR